VFARVRRVFKMVGKSWRFYVLLGLVVALLAGTSGLVMASNMGFKINKGLQASFVSTKAPDQDNWVSLPYNSPYNKAKNICLALPSAVATVTIEQINPTGGGTLSFGCDALASDPANFTVNNTLGVRIRNSAVIPPTSSVFVGSSNESVTLQVIGGFVSTKAPDRDNWLNVPYHTTWSLASHVCATLGALGDPSTNVARLEGSTGSTTTYSCAAPVADLSNFSLVIGEAILVRRTLGNIAPFLPPHF
jgi:hypothetical protein